MGGKYKTFLHNDAECLEIIWTCVSKISKLAGEPWRTRRPCLFFPKHIWEWLPISLRSVDDLPLHIVLVCKYIARIVCKALKAWCNYRLALQIVEDPLWIIDWTVDSFKRVSSARFIIPLQMNGAFGVFMKYQSIFVNISFFASEPFPLITSPG